MVFRRRLLLYALPVLAGPNLLMQASVFAGSDEYNVERLVYQVTGGMPSERLRVVLEVPVTGELSLSHEDALRGIVSNVRSLKVANEDWRAEVLRLAGQLPADKVAPSVVPGGLVRRLEVTFGDGRKEVIHAQAHPSPLAQRLIEALDQRLGEAGVWFLDP